MDGNDESMEVETGEKEVSKMKVIDTRGEKADGVQAEAYEKKIQENVEKQLMKFETLMGPYTKQKVSEGFGVNLVDGPVGSGEVVDGKLAVNLPNRSEIKAAEEDTRAKPFVDILRNAGVTYEDFAVALAESTTLHESEHMIIDSRPESKLEEDFEKATNIKNDEGGHTLSLLDEGITYAFQLEMDSEKEIFKKIQGEKPSAEESFTVRTRKMLGEALRIKVKEYADGGKPVDDKLLEFAGEEMKKLDIEKYVEEAENERWKRNTEKVASKLHDVWREPRRIEGTNRFEPRIKVTKDELWISNHDGKNEIDIANTDFEELPEDWKKENMDSANVAVSEVRRAIKEKIPLDDKFVESASEVQHIQWLIRNGAWASLEQKLPYDQLSEVEKEKDRAVVRTAVRIGSN